MTMKLSTPSGEHVVISGIKLDIAVIHKILTFSKYHNLGFSEMWPANFVSLKLTDFNL